MTTLAPILLYVFLCFCVFVAACVILLFVASFRAMPPSSFAE